MQLQVARRILGESNWKGQRCNLEVSDGMACMADDLRREAAGGSSVATTAKPIDDGGARLLVEDNELVSQAWTRWWSSYWAAMAPAPIQLK